MRSLLILFLGVFLSLTPSSVEKVGIASWYGIPFHGRTTANGETYDMDGFTCATTWNAETRRLGYPFGTLLEVTNIENGKTVIVRVNDTGSFGEKYGRSIDLSKGAFNKIANLDTGIINVKIKRIEKEETDDSWSGSTTIYKKVTSWWTRYTSPLSRVFEVSKNYTSSKMSAIRKLLLARLRNMI